MYSNKVTPIRTCVGNAATIQSVKLKALSPKASTFSYQLGRLNKLSDAENTDLAAYHPRSINYNGTDYPAIGGTGSYRLPAADNLPFASTAVAGYIHGLLPGTAKTTSRELWIDIEITLNKKILVGGVSFAGCPQLLYSVDNHGENSANFGLPREIRLSWEGETTAFLDDENAFTRQEPVSHSGVHFITCGPIFTDKLVMRLADWPKFLTAIGNAAKPGDKPTTPGQTGDESDTDDCDKDTPAQSGKKKKSPAANKSGFGGAASCNPVPVFQYGLVIPFIVVYEYRESTSYRPHLPAGLLACTKQPGLSLQNRFCARPGESPDLTEQWNADHLYFIDSPEKAYNVFSAASAFDQARQYSLNKVRFPEYFISVPFGSGEQINIYAEQAHDSVRCCSGIRINFPDKMLKGILERRPMHLKVYEIDITEGLSPLMIAPAPAKEKYTCLIYEDDVPLSTNQFAIRFIRPSLSRYFLLSFSITGDEPGVRTQVTLQNISFVQSAHISITTRPAHNLIIDSLHFRFTGNRLAEDYARIGEKGFCISVESVAGGQRKNVLFSANSLLELLNMGSTKMFANMRREEVKVDVSKESSETLAGSFDEHTTVVNNENWRKTETGDDVKWAPVTDNGLSTAHRAKARAFELSRKGNFENYSSSEIRTYNDLIGHEGVGAYASRVRDLLNVLFSNTQVQFPDNLFTEEPTLLRPDNNNFDWKNKVWKGFDPAQEQFWVSEVKSLSIPPWLAALSTSNLDEVKKLIDNIASGINHGGLPNLPDLNGFMQLLYDFPPFGLVNGLSIGASLSVSAVAGLSVSTATGQLLPSMNYSSTSGTSGSVSKQGSKTAYSFSQYLSAGQDISKSFTEHDKGVMNRRVTRELNQPGTVRERTRGVEVMWQDTVCDIITGKIPLGLSFQATGNNYFQCADQSIRVKFSGFSEEIEADVWFEVLEEPIKEDF